MFFECGRKLFIHCFLSQIQPVSFLEMFRVLIGSKNRQNYYSNFYSTLHILKNIFIIMSVINPNYFLKKGIGPFASVESCDLPISKKKIEHFGNDID